MKIILASQSPRRRELMDLAGFEYEVISSNFEEKTDSSLSLEEQSISLAYGKAKDVFDNTQGDRCIIGADTLVILDNEQLGKPKNRDEAREMLNKIQGRMHEVFTSFSIIIEKNGNIKEYKDLDITNVYIKKMTQSEIENYIETDIPYDKAGGYAIQSVFSVFVDKIEGNYNTVMGLPINKIYNILKENDII